MLCGAIQGFFLMLLLSSKSKKEKADRLLMVWLVLMAFQLLFYVDNLSQNPLLPNLLQVLGFSLPLLNAAVLYLYVYILSFGNNFKWSGSWKYVLPYLVFNLLAFGFNISAPRNITFNQAIPYFSRDVYPLAACFLTALLAVVPAYYTVKSLIVLVKYQRQLSNKYSYTEQINLGWLKWIVISLLFLFAGLFILVRFGVHLGWLNYQNLFAVVGSILALYVYFIGYFGLRQTTVFASLSMPSNEMGEKETPARGYKRSGLNEEAAGKIFEMLKLHMQETKPFLDDQLSLSTLAQQLNLTPNQLSQVINQQASANFFNFINSYRIEAVKQKLKDPAFAHYSILSIAFDCGFRSKASFNKIFKEMTGTTPHAYQKS